MARTAEQAWNRKRSLEGGDFERVAVPHALVRDGYEVDDLGRAHMSKGAFDWVAFKPGQIVFLGARLTTVNRLTGKADLSPGFSSAELAKLWRYVELFARPGLEVVAALATAEHGPSERRDGTWGPCRCSRFAVDPENAVRYLRLTGPPAGRSRRGDWEPWSPDFAAPPVGALPVLSA
jgi:hypothetical protein